MFLKVSRSELHGQGCFTTREVMAGDTLGTNRILVFPPEQTRHLFATHLKNYLFFVKDGGKPDVPFFSALAMGPISFCNHSAEPNCDFQLDEAIGEITLTARRAIRADEEITIDYGDYAEEIL